jgi:murein DD-endopeptidase MepM/ murein hydrolase activator NlpD
MQAICWGLLEPPSGSSSTSVNEGDIIEAGAVLGQTGDTGNSTGIHLHFEVRRCDKDGSCTIRDPNSVLLPGQISYCEWEMLGGER